MRYITLAYREVWAVVQLAKHIGALVAEAVAATADPPEINDR
jgi:hypothetical protein